MSCNCIVKVLIENNVAAAMGPASYVYCYANGRWMSCRIFNMYAHNRVLSAHTLRSKADLVNSVFQKFFHTWQVAAAPFLEKLWY